MNVKKLVITGLAGTALVAMAAAPVQATGKITDKKVGICHATGSAKNPYVFIVVSKNAADAHKKHQDGKDVIGAKSIKDCPKGEVKSDKDEKKDETTKDESKGGESKGGSGNGTTLGTATSLPETGAAAGLSALIGIPAMALAGRAYMRSRANR